jgi:hypothetical protein
MIYTTATLEKRIELADVFQTVRAQEARILALIEFYQSISVDVLRMKAGNGFLDMEKVEKAVAAVELAFDGENV